MHRGHMYSSWDDVQQELSGSVKSFAPHGVRNQQVNLPIISLSLFYIVKLKDIFSVTYRRYLFFRLAPMLVKEKRFSRGKVIYPAITLSKKFKIIKTYFDD